MIVPISMELHCHLEQGEREIAVKEETRGKDVGFPAWQVRARITMHISIGIKVMMTILHSVEFLAIIAGDVVIEIAFQ